MSQKVEATHAWLESSGLLSLSLALAIRHDFMITDTELPYLNSCLPDY